MCDFYPPQPLRNAVEDQVGGGTPPRSNPAYWNGPIPWVSVKDFEESRSSICDAQEHISLAGLNACSSKLIPENTPLICTRMAVGRSALAQTAVAINQDVKALFPKTGYSASYLLRILQFIRPVAEAKSVGSTVKGIRIQDYLDIPAHLAPPEDQTVIARILDTLDTAIQQTEAILEKLKAVKQGLLHDLLTRGIDANGQLRPPQSEAPHLYKESPLGWIPKEWEVRQLADYTSSEITYGIVQAGPHIENGIPYIRTGDMSGDRFDLDSLLRTSRSIAANFKRSEVHSGDIVMAIRATVGKVLMVPDELDGANLTQGTAKLSPRSTIDRFFFLWSIRHSRAQKSILDEVKGTTFAEITLAALRKIKMAAPEKQEEQRVIGSMLQECEMHIQTEIVYLQKLKKQKIALMDDLLTGRVRVTPLLENAA